jgi:hypothetical protein
MLRTRHDCPTNIDTVDVDGIVRNIRVPLMPVTNESLNEFLYVASTMYQRSASTNVIHEEFVLDKPPFGLVAHNECADVVVDLGAGHAGHDAHVHQSSELTDRCMRISNV